ncbi:14229_t:CDS:2 [Racocetra fulgida]|uniref:14229_t:CDS:1 n=1 Tax=Racocetra fulgida TaxID=60492 RepID=A0A9N9A112_9GLOM|nr:14229_t:CDS:2 [Racocetra fulgida]
MGNKRKKYVGRSCIRCKGKKIKCQKDDGPNCEACIRRGEECVTPENTKKRGPKPRLLITTAIATVPSNKSSKEQKNGHPQGVPCLNANTQQLPENVQYGTFSYQSCKKPGSRNVMINGDKGEDYERKQNLQLSEAIKNEIVSFDSRESKRRQPEKQQNILLKVENNSNNEEDNLQEIVSDNEPNQEVNSNISSEVLIPAKRKKSKILTKLK